MRRIREVLRLRAELGPNLSAISAGAKLARSTVRAYLDRAAAGGAGRRCPRRVVGDGAGGGALPAVGHRWSHTARLGRGGSGTAAPQARHAQAALDGVQGRIQGGLGFSQFKLRLSEWQKASGRGLSMRQVHHAGETVQVDYAGDTVVVVDDGTSRAAQIFVACLPCSGLIYAEASWTQATEDWLGAHVRLFAFLGGVPAKVVPEQSEGRRQPRLVLRPGDQRQLCRIDQALRHRRGPGSVTQASGQAGGRKWRVAGLSLASGPAAASAILLVDRAEPGDRAAAG